MPRDGLRVWAALILWAAAACGQGLPLEPPRDAGASITGSFEGWFTNPDGTFSLLLGYYNRNRNQEVEIPIGPDNRIEPGGPDRGQPTHFYPGRGWGMFVVQVPRDFGENKITWTLTVNNQTTTIPANLKADWVISPFQEAATSNTPPVLGFEEKGPTVQGPLAIMAERTAKVGVPLELPVLVSDDAKFSTSSGVRPKVMPPPVRLRWSLYRAPGPVTISDPRPAVKPMDKPGVPFAGTASTTATFSEPGEYMLHVTANDYSGEGGGGFQCCWTTARVKVRVTR
jgi:hypothetical protein